jgi:hypothetical protein
LDAVDHNALLVALPLLAALGVLLRRRGLEVRTLVISGAVLVVTFWVVRNLSWWPYLDARAS